MIRMEIALILVLLFIACMYFSAERPHTLLHKTFSVLLITVIVHLIFDAATIYTVNHLDSVPAILNRILHRMFIGTMALVVYLFYQYIAILVQEETGKTRLLDTAARMFLVVAEIGVIFYLFLCAGLMITNWKQIHPKKKFAIGAAMTIEFTVCALQAFYPTWLISGMGITLMTLAFYLTLENPDILRAELTEQKMSMLYLKSQVNPHFLYNTLDTIRIIRMEQAKKLLLSMPLSIAEVSERSGYGDYRVFTKAFKKSEGVTPSQYRRNFLEE